MRGTGLALACGGLNVTEHRVRHVRLLQPFHILSRQLKLLACQSVVQMTKFGRADDRRSNTWPVQQPRQGYLSRLHAASCREFSAALRDIEVGVGVVQRVAERIGTGPDCVPLATAAAVSGQHPARKRAPRNDGHALVDALRDHLPLFLPINEVVVVLHRHESGPAVPVRGVLRLGELPRVHAAGPDVPSLARLHHVVQCMHGLLNRSVVVPPVNLVQVDVIHVQAAQRRVDSRHDVLARQAAVVLARSHWHEDLCRHDELVTAEEFRKQPAGRNLTGAARIGVRGVEERDATLNGCFHDRFGRSLVEHPLSLAVIAVTHHAEANAGHSHACRTEVDVLHDGPPLAQCQLLARSSSRGATRLSPSRIPYRAYNRRSGRGAHQLARPSKRIVAGTSMTRTIDASTTRATIMPTPSNLMKVIPDAENAPITMTRSSAALVIMLPVRCSPLATASVLSPVTSYRSRTLDSRNTS